MRELIFSDAFHIARIAKKIGVAKILEVQKQAQIDYKLISEKYKKDSTKMEIELAEIQQNLGIRLGEVLIDGFAEAEIEITYLYSAVTGDTVENVKKYPIEKVIDLFKEFVEVNGKERLLGFFTKAMQ
jgi:hypothetical protein